MISQEKLLLFLQVNKFLRIFSKTLAGLESVQARAVLNMHLNGIVETP